MERLSPRLKTKIPVKIEFGKKNVEAMIMDISGDGAFLEGKLESEDGFSDGVEVLLKYSMPKGNTFEHCGRIIWKSDNGIGIREENMERLFTHGFTTRKDGHGFGLHSSCLAAQEMGGSLTASSDGPGLGATFVLEIPDLVYEKAHV